MTDCEMDSDSGSGEEWGLQDLAPELVFHITRFVRDEDVIWWKRACRLTRDAVAKIHPVWNEGEMGWWCCVQSMSRIRWARFVDGGGRKWYHDACFLATNSGNLEILKWMLADGCKWHSGACVYAALTGKLDMLQWIHDGDEYEFDSDAFQFAAHGGHWEILEWAIRKGYLGNHRWCEFAAQGGQLEILKWLRNPERNCPWDEGACMYAAEGGHLDVLIWLRQNGCPWDRDQCLTWGRKHPEIVAWIEENP
jgi:hypothetical protein